MFLSKYNHFYYSQLNRTSTLTCLTFSNKQFTMYSSNFYYQCFIIIVLVQMNFCFNFTAFNEIKDYKIHGFNIQMLHRYLYKNYSPLYQMHNFLFDYFKSNPFTRIMKTINSYLTPVRVFLHVITYW